MAAPPHLERQERVDSWPDLPPVSDSAPYVTLVGVFAALLALAARPSGRSDEGRIDLLDLVTLGLASQDAARIVARDRITVFLRAPFASGDAAQHPRGRGLRRAVGELLTCPSCLSLWMAALVGIGFRRAPGPTRLIASVFAGHALGELQESIARRASEA